MIDSVLFDMGGTLEDVEYNHEIRLRGAQLVLDRLRQSGIKLATDDEAFLRALEKGNAEYKAWSAKNMLEIPAAKVWAEWNLRDFSLPEDIVAGIGEDLASLWETEFYIRKLRPGVPEMLEKLARGGYKLGIISNTVSRRQVFVSLKEYGIDKYFGCICLSSIEGIRKPKPEIFIRAVKLLSSAPQRAAYVGDTVSRDVVGAKNAGYALAIQIHSFLTSMADTEVDKSCRPDYLIEDITDIPDILDKLNG